MDDGHYSFNAVHIHLYGIGIDEAIFQMKAVVN